MNQQKMGRVISPDEETLQAWENMRIEILHELQEGGISEIPDSYLDDIGYVVVELASWRAQQKQSLMKALTKPNNEITKNMN